MKIYKILWFIIIIIIIGWIYYLFISPKIFKKKEYEIPNIENLSIEDGIAILDENNFNYKISYISGESDKIAYTVPTANTKIYKDFTINVYVETKLPTYYSSFIGLMYDSNIDMINEYCKKNDIILSTIYELNNSYQSGIIFEQSKKTSEIITPGSELILKIAVSDEYITMPNLIDMNIYDVIKILDSYDLKYNIVYYNSPIEEDIIISQSILPGQIVKKGNNNYFNIYVSNGLC